MQDDGSGNGPFVHIRHPTSSIQAAFFSSLFGMTLSDRRVGPDPCRAAARATPPRTPRAPRGGRATLRAGNCRDSAQQSAWGDDVGPQAAADRSRQRQFPAPSDPGCGATWVGHRGAYGQSASTGGHFRRSSDWRRSVSGDLRWCCRRRVLYRRWNIDHVFPHSSQRSSSTNSITFTTQMGPPRHRRHTYSLMAGQGAGLLASSGIQRWGLFGD
jgi:hypothetical protein